MIATNHHDAKPNHPSAVKVASIIEYLTEGDYESGHWIQRALSTYPFTNLPHFIKEDIESMMRKAICALMLEIKGDVIRLYRGMRQQRAQDSPIGAHWTVDQDIAAGFGEYVYAVDASLDEVDWVATVARRMAWPNEREVAVQLEGRLLEHKIVARNSVQESRNDLVHVNDENEDALIESRKPRMVAR